MAAASSLCSAPAQSPRFPGVGQTTNALPRSAQEAWRSQQRKPDDYLIRNSYHGLFLLEFNHHINI